MRFRAVLPPLAPSRGAVPAPVSKPACDLSSAPPMARLEVRPDVRVPARRTRHLTTLQLKRQGVASWFVAAVAVAASAATSVASAARDPGAALWPMSQPAHRAIFCGEADTQTGFEYATALNGALNQLTRSGRSVPQAMDMLRGRARCAAGSELPDPASAAAPVVTPSLIGSQP
jgi:hypothetical protein